MTSKPFRVFVITSDKYLDTLRPFAWLFNRYWVPSPDVVVCGFASPTFKLPPNFSFVSMGNQADYPINKWTDAVIEFVTAQPDDVFALMLEDMWLTRHVDSRAVTILADYMHQFEYVCRIDLTGDRLYAHGMQAYGHVEHIDLIKSMPGSPYHLSMMPGLWRKKHLLATFQRGWTPWDVELAGTTVLSHNQAVIVLGTRQWPVRILLAHRSGDAGRLMLEGLDNELDRADVEALRELGYLKRWEEV